MVNLSQLKNENDPLSLGFRAILLTLDCWIRYLSRCEIGLHLVHGELLLRLGIELVELIRALIVQCLLTGSCYLMPSLTCWGM